MSCNTDLNLYEVLPDGSRTTEPSGQLLLLFLLYMTQCSKKCTTTTQCFSVTFSNYINRQCDPVTGINTPKAESPLGRYQLKGTECEASPSLPDGYIASDEPGLYFKVNSEYANYESAKTSCEKDLAGKTRMLTLTSDKKAMVFKDFKEKQTQQFNLCGKGWTQFEDVCFQLTQISETQDEGQSRCRALGEGSELASILNEREFNFVKENDWLKEGSFFIGLKDTSPTTRMRTWEWADGSAFEYSAWRENEPNNPDEEKCVVVLVSDDYKWNDAVCTKKLPSLCKKPLGFFIGLKQIGPTEMKWVDSSIISFSSQNFQVTFTGHQNFQDQQDYDSEGTSDGRDCFYIGSHTDKWHEISCDVSVKYICEYQQE